jgi:hypothetical protein
MGGDNNDERMRALLRVRDLFNKAIDPQTPSEEARTCAMAMLRIVDKYGFRFHDPERAKKKTPKPPTAPNPFVEGSIESMFIDQLRKVQFQNQERAKTVPMFEIALSIGNCAQCGMSYLRGTNLFKYKDELVHPHCLGNFIVKKGA